jgi:hypothetical protein
VSFNDAASDVEAKASTRGVAGRAVRRQATVRFEDGLQLPKIDARTLVGDADPSRGAIRPQADPNSAALRVLDRVRQEVEQHLRHAVGVAHARQRGRRVNRDGVLGRGGRYRLDLLA